MRLDVSVNHIRLLPSRKYPGCQPVFCQCSHWLLPTFHYAKCGFLHMRWEVFYGEDGQETHPGSIRACQPWKECPQPAAYCEQVFKSLWQGKLQQQTTTSSSIPPLQFQWFNTAEDKASEIGWAVQRQMYLHSKPAVENPAPHPLPRPAPNPSSPWLA